MAFCSACGFQIADDAAFCSKCGTRQGAAAVSQTAVVDPGVAGASRARQQFAGFAIVVVGAVAVGWWVTRDSSPTAKKAVSPLDADPTLPRAAPPADAAPPDLLTQVRSWTFTEVLEATPFVDEREEVSIGTRMLLSWARANMKLSDVKVAKDETTFKRAMKDSEAERGKRLCVTGRIVQIRREGDGDESVYAGIMNIGSSFDFVHFNAVRDTGSIVEGSRSRFCGVVTGRYSYGNVGGGTTHSIRVVGVFDIPANRTAPPPKPEPPATLELVPKPAPVGAKKKAATTLRCVPPEYEASGEPGEAEALAKQGYRVCPGQRKAQPADAGPPLE